MWAAMGRWRERRRLKREYDSAVAALTVEQENYRNYFRSDLGPFERLNLERALGDAQERLWTAHAAYEEAKAAR